ncbi:MAG TPA: NAD-dependent deacetylase [Actinobacteria bacterium]|nr:NAD-dependent deacetylase [Actinomycetota bacterium]
MADELARAVEVLSDAARILVFTGAGISTPSGIPDFRGPDGLWTRIDPEDYHYDRHVGDAEFRRRTWERHLASPFLGARPNPAHHAVTALWAADRTAGVVTQNVDGLHQAAGIPPVHLVELHGNAARIACISCGRREPVAPVAARWRAGEEDPRCLACGGVLKPDVVFFGEVLPRREVIRAWAMADDADAVLVVGSTLSVFPAASIPLELAERGRPLVIVNRGPTDHDGFATARLDGDAAVLLPALVAELGADAASPRR